MIGGMLKALGRLERMTQAGQLSAKTPALMGEALRLAFARHDRAKLLEMRSTLEWRQLISRFPVSMTDTQLDDEILRRLNAFKDVLKEVPAREGQEHSPVVLFFNFIPLLEEGMEKEKNTCRRK